MVRKNRIGMKFLLIMFIGVIILTIPLFVSASSGSGPRSAATIDNLFLHYKFESLNWDGEPDEVVDNLGNVHGKSHGAQADPSGKVGRCAEFDSTSWIELSDNVLVSSKFSLSLWFNIDNDSIDSGYKPLFMQKNLGEGIGYNKFLLRLNGTTNKPELFMRGLQNNDVGKLIEVNKTLNKDAWYHLVVLFDETNVQIYINNDLKITEAHGTDGNFQDYVQIVAIGGHSSEGFFHGKIDDFRVYNDTLTASEITSIFNLEDELPEEPKEEVTTEEEESSSSSKKDEKKEEETTNQTTTENETVSFPLTFNVFEIYAFLSDRLGPGGAFAFVLFNFLISFGAVTMYRVYEYNKRPILYTNSSSLYKHKKLGRLISCEEVKFPQLSGYFRILIKDKLKGYISYYCKEHVEQMLERVWFTFNFGLGIWKFLPHYYINEVQLPLALQFKVPILKESWGNKAKYYLFRILNVLPCLMLARWVYNSLQFDEKKAETIDTIKILQLEYLKERKYLEYFVEFERKEYFEDQDVEGWIKYPGLELVSIIQDDQEHLYSDYEKCVEQISPLKEEVRTLEQEYPLIEMSTEEGYEQLDEEPQELVAARNALQLVLNKYQFTEELMEKFEGIIKIIEKKKAYQQKLIDHGIMDEKDQYFFRALFQIYDMERDPSYRKVNKIGEPIPRIREITNFNLAIQEALDYRELLSMLELKVQQERNERKESDKRYQEERDKNTKLHVEMEQRIEQIIKKVREFYQNRTSSKVDFALEVLQLTEDTDFEAKDAIQAKMKEYLDKKNDDTQKVKQLEKENEQLKAFLSKVTPKEETFKIEFSDQMNPPVRGLRDLRTMKEDPNNGGD